MQQPTKKLNNPDYFRILEALNIKEDLVVHSNAEIAIWNGTQSVLKQKRKRKQFRQKALSTKRPASYLQRSPQTPEMVSKPIRKTELSERRETVSLSTNEKQLLELKGPAAYGSVKYFQKSTNLKPNKVKLFLEGKKANTESCCLRHKRDLVAGPDLCV